MGCSTEEIAEVVGLTRDAVNAHKWWLGLSKSRGHREWTLEEDALVIFLIGTAHWTSKRIGTLLGRSKNSVVGRAHRMMRDKIVPWDHFPGGAANKMTARIKTGKQNAKNTRFKFGANSK